MAERWAIRDSRVVIHVVNSTLGYGLAYVLAYFVNELGLTLAGWWAGRDPILYHNTMTFGAAGSDLAWGGGVAATLTVGLLVLAVYVGPSPFGAARITVLWLVYHLLRQGLLQLVAVPFSPESDAARAGAVLGIPDVLTVIVAGVSLVVMIGIAMGMARDILRFAPNRRILLTRGDRLSFAASMTLIPAVLGGLLAVPYLLPASGSAALAALPWAGAFTLFTVGTAAGIGGLDLEESATRPRPPVWLVAGSIAVLVFFRLYLADGVPIPPV